MQPWQSGRSREKINRIRAKHPGIDLDILKQYKLIYEWIKGKNLIEVFELINVDSSELLSHLKKINYKGIGDLNKKGYLVADMKPEHIIISEENTERIKEIGSAQDIDAPGKQIELLYQLLNDGNYSVIDYELLSRTPQYEEAVKSLRR